MKSLIVLLLALGLNGCLFNHAICPEEPCSLEATVVDLSGTENCGLLFELKDGTRLIPLRLTYIKEPTPAEDPIYHYNLTAGEKVYISYNQQDYASACMAGEVVFITCIRSATDK